MEKNCQICQGNLLQIIGRSKTKDGYFLCKNCTQRLGDNVFKIRKLTLAELIIEYHGSQGVKKTEEVAK